MGRKSLAITLGLALIIATESACVAKGPKCSLRRISRAYSGLIGIESNNEKGRDVYAMIRLHDGLEFDKALESIEKSLKPIVGSDETMNLIRDGVAQGFLESSKPLCAFAYRRVSLDAESKKKVSEIVADKKLTLGLRKLRIEVATEVCKEFFGDQKLGKVVIPRREDNLHIISLGRGSTDLEPIRLLIDSEIQSDLEITGDQLRSITAQTKKFVTGNLLEMSEEYENAFMDKDPYEESARIRDLVNSMLTEKQKVRFRQLMNQRYMHSGSLLLALQFNGRRLDRAESLRLLALEGRLKAEQEAAVRLGTNLWWRKKLSEIVDLEVVQKVQGLRPTYLRNVSHQAEPLLTSSVIKKLEKDFNKSTSTNPRRR